MEPFLGWNVQRKERQGGVGSGYVWGNKNGVGKVGEGVGEWTIYGGRRFHPSDRNYQLKWVLLQLTKSVVRYVGVVGWGRWDGVGVLRGENLFNRRRRC